jgi:hypothetical protein
MHSHEKRLVVVFEIYGDKKSCQSLSGGISIIAGSNVGSPFLDKIAVRLLHPCNTLF